jgi:general secretion pathway protein N
MRPLGAFLVISFALTATAAAGSLDQPTAPAPLNDGASAPATQRTGVADTAGLSGTPRTPDPREKSRPGNPLWTVPLDALSGTRDRPLFSTSRRPPIVPVPVVVPPLKQEALAPPSERPLLTLIGTIVSPNASVAMLQGSGAEAISRLRVGQENDGWQVRGISLRSIVVEKGAQSVELDMPHNETPAESYLPNIPAAADKASPPPRR